MTQFYVAEGKFDRLKKRAMAIIDGAGGAINRSSRLRKLKVDAVTFKKIVLTLEMCDLIESECGEHGMTRYRLAG